MRFVSPSRQMPRPMPAAFGIGVLAQALFCWRLTTPRMLVFDEIHYVPAARTLAALTAPANIEHPLVGKMLIALGIALAGDGPLGWRLMSTLAGTAVVVGVFAILWLAFGRVRTAMLGSLLTLLNFTVFVQARIAMLDGFMAAFVVAGVAAMLWAMRATGPQAVRRWLAGSVLLGLAVATKWAAVPFVAYAAIAFGVLKRRDATRWPGLGWTRACTMLGVASLATYVATFAPAFFYVDDALTWRGFVPLQREMYALQTQTLPAHLYQSSWWTWPLSIRPIWYLYQPADGAQRGILMLGNPAVMWGGLIAVAGCLWAGVRHGHTKLGAIGALWLGSYAVWAIIPKSLGFYYYYYLPSIWLPVAIAAMLDRRADARRGVAVLIVSAGLFVWFYPILSAVALPDPRGFQRWMWFDGWR